MTDVQTGARGVGKHVEHVVLGLVGIEAGVPRVLRTEDPGVAPDPLPVGLDAGRVFADDQRTQRLGQGTGYLCLHVVVYISLSAALYDESVSKVD